MARPQLQAAPPPVIDLVEWPSLSPSQSSALPSRNPPLQNQKQTSFPPKAIPRTKKFKQNPVSPPYSAAPSVPHNQTHPKPRENSLSPKAVPTTSSFIPNSPLSKPIPTATTSNRYFKSEDPPTPLPSTPLSPPPKPQQQHNRKRSYTSDPPLTHSIKVIKTTPEHVPIDLQCETVSFDFNDQEQWPSLYSPCHTSPSAVLLCKVPAHMSISPQSPPSLCSTIPYDLPDEDQISQSPTVPEFVNFCSLCYDSLKLFKVPLQGQKNYLYLTDIPAQLSSLNSIERRLISQVHPYMKLILLPFGQSAMNGQVINFPYEVEDNYVTSD